MLRHGFRDMQPIDLWSATLCPDTDLASFRESVRALSIDMNEGFSGFTTQEGEQVRTFTRTRYPRKKYGVPDIDEIVVSTNLLAEKLGNIQVIDETKTRKKLFRVVLGLLEGYDESSHLHTIEEVREALGGTSLHATQAEVFAARPDGIASCDIYTEPCAVIIGNPEETGAVYDLADTFGQQRFTVEDFDKRLAWVVETPHCTTPDPE